MSMALAGVGFSFGMESAGISTALSKVQGKMASVADAFGQLRAQAVDGIFNAVEGGFSAVMGGAKSLIAGMRMGLGAIPGTVTAIGGAFQSAGEIFGKFLGGPILMFAGGAKKAFQFLGDTISATFSKDTLNSMTSGLNLTAGLEGEAVSTGKTIRELGANFGFYGKKLDDFVSKGTAMSISMQIGGDQAAKALRGWIEASGELRAMGFDSAQALARFTAAFGIDADLLRNSGMQMRKELGLTDEQIRNVIGSTARMGKNTGDVTSAMNTMPALLKNMRDQASRMGIALDNVQLTDFAAQTNALASGFMTISQTSDDAREKAMELATTILKTSRDFEGLFAGTQTELNDFTKELAISTGNVETAFDLMRSGPSGFVQGMIDMVAQAKKSGKLTTDQLQFVNQRLSKVLGDEAASNLINTFKAADQATLDAMTSTHRATDSLNVMGKEAFRTGRTMAQEFEYASDVLLTRFRALGKPEARKWLSRMRKALKGFGDQIEDIAKGDGPLAAFVKKLSEASSLGAQAFVPEGFQATTMVMQEAFKLAEPTIDALQKLGINFTSLSGIINLAATALAVFAADMALNRKEGESWGVSASRTLFKFKDSIVSTVRTVGSWLERAATWFAEFDISKAFEIDVGATDPISLALKEMSEELGEWGTAEKWIEIGNKFATGFGNMWTAVSENESLKSGFSTVTSSITNFFLDLVDQIPWAEIADKAITAFSSAMQTAWDNSSVWESWKAGIGIGTSDEAATKRANQTLVAPVRRRDAEQVANTAKKVAEDTSNMLMSTLDQTQSTAEQASEELQNIVDQAQSTADQANASMMSIFDTVKDNTEHSMNTYVADDLAKMINVFGEAADTINSIMNNMFLNVIGSMHDVLAEVEQAAIGIVRNLEAIGAMEMAIASSGQREVVTPAQDKERDARIAKMTSDEAIHTPLWYAGSQGYERLFTAKMDALIAAVASTAPGPTLAAAGPRPATPMKAPATSRARIPSGSRG